MRFEINKKGNVCFSEIHPIIEGFIKCVGINPIEMLPKGASRILQSPIEASNKKNPKAEEIKKDWDEYVKPEIQSHFDNERNIVLKDLMSFKNEKLTIPKDHMEAWLTSLNAMRLALAAQHDLTEEELTEEEHIPGGLENTRVGALIQVKLFAFMQECIIQALEMPPPPISKDNSDIEI